MSKTLTSELTEEELKNIKTICEYLFFDQFSRFSTYLRFERCIQPLFSEEKNFDLEELYKQICGPKKKYLNFKRFVNAYLKYKHKQGTPLLNLFFDKLFNSILQKESIGSLEEKRFTFSTTRLNKRRECISLIEILIDKEQKIHGINLTYDDAFKNRLYPTKLEGGLFVGLEVALKVLDEEKLEK